MTHVPELDNNPGSVGLGGGGGGGDLGTQTVCKYLVKGWFVWALFVL